MQKNKDISRWLFWLSLSIYFLSLAVPAYKTDMQSVGVNQMDHYGIEALLLGPVGFFAGHFSWLANPFLWISWTKRDISPGGEAAFWAFLSLIAAILFFIPKSIAVGSSGEYPYHAAIGFYLWIVSIATAFVSACLHPAYIESAEVDTEILEK